MTRSRSAMSLAVNASSSSLAGVAARAQLGRGTTPSADAAVAERVLDHLVGGDRRRGERRQRRLGRRRRASGRALCGRGTSSTGTRSIERAASRRRRGRLGATDELDAHLRQLAVGEVDLAARLVLVRHRLGCELALLVRRAADALARPATTCPGAVSRRTRPGSKSRITVEPRWNMPSSPPRANGRGDA